MPTNTTAAQDKIINAAESSTAVADLIDIIEQLDDALTEAKNELAEALERIKELEASHE